MNLIPDNDIIGSVIAGNFQDYSILVDRYKIRAFSLAKRMLKSEMDAQEVIQDAFLKAYSNLRLFRYESKFSTWLYRIVYNTALNKLKSRHSETFNISLEDIAHEYEYDAGGYEALDRGKILNELINQLPPQYGAALNLFYFEQIGCEEIGHIMQIETNNVKVILHRARKALALLIEKKRLKEELI